MLPKLLVTIGDVAGIGPEVIARAWPDLLALCRPVVVGDPDWLNCALALIGSVARVRSVRDRRKPNRPRQSCRA